MKFGILVVGENTTEQNVELAKLMEKSGFDVMWVADERFHRDVYVTMAACIMNTHRIQFGTLVTDPYVRHPALTAVAIATLDELSKGRVILGMGAGGSAFDQLCLKRPKPAMALEEAITVIRDMFHGKPSLMDGQIIKCNGAKLNFDCRPDIPIYVAARGPQMLQKAGKLADGVVIASFATTQGIAYGLEQVKKGINERSPDLGKIKPVSYTYCSLSGDRKAARENVRGGVTLPIFGSSDILTKIGFKEEEVKPLLKFLEENKDKWTFGNPVYQQFLQMVTPNMIDGFSIAGDADLFVTKLKEIEKLGIDNFIAFPFPHTFESIRGFIDKFSKEVMPRMGH